MNALTRLCHMAIEHKEGVTRRKKEALEEKRSLLQKLEKQRDDHDKWSKEMRREIEAARKDLKVRTNGICYTVDE